jgi:uncharacterized cupredoxin-like copper-binding protein
VAGALLAAALALAACGGGNGGAGKTPTATKPATKAATEQIASTPTAAPTPTPPAATAAGAQPSATPVPTQPPLAQPSNTPPPGGQTTIGVSLREFSLGLSAGTAPAGSVTFNVSNDGTIAHNFLVIKTDLAADALPMDQAGYMVDESQVNVVRKLPSMEHEEAAAVKADLAAGRYVLICNVATHYETGMRVAFAVQ